jgi:hypothetical protein
VSGFRFQGTDCSQLRVHLDVLGTCLRSGLMREGIRVVESIELVVKVVIALVLVLDTALNSASEIIIFDYEDEDDDEDDFKNTISVIYHLSSVICCPSSETCLNPQPAPDNQQPLTQNAEPRTFESRTLKSLDIHSGLNYLSFFLNM